MPCATPDVQTQPASFVPGPVGCPACGYTGIIEDSECMVCYSMKLEDERDLGPKVARLNGANLSSEELEEVMGCMAL